MLAFLASHPATCAAVLIAALAFWKGSPSERAAALVIAFSWGASLLIPLFLPKPTTYAVLRVPYAVVGVDLVAAVAFLALALRYSRIWLAVAVLLQGGILSLHGAFLAGNGGSGYTYVTRVNLVSDLVLLLVLGATIAAWVRRARQHGGPQAARTPSAQPLAGLAG